MKKFFSSYLKQIIIGVTVGIFLFLLTAMGNSIKSDLSKKASKEYVDKGIIEQEKNIELIKKDIHYIKENLERIEDHNNETLDRMENKIDQIRQEIK